MQCDLRCRIACRMPGQVVIAAPAHAQARIAVGRAVGHGCVGNPGRVRGARPEGAAGRTDVVFVQRLRAMPAAAGAVEDVTLRMAVRAQQQQMREVAQQGEQALAVGRTEGFHRPRNRGVEERNVRREHQQPILRQRRQIGREEGELRLAQAADIVRLLPGTIDHVVEHDERRFGFFPGVAVRAEVLAKAAQGILVARGVEVEVMVAGHVQPWHAQPGGGRGHRRIQGEIVVDDVAQAQSDVGGQAAQVQRCKAVVHRDRAVTHHRVDDVARVVVDIGAGLGLRVAEHEHLQSLEAARRVRVGLQREIPAFWELCRDPAVLQQWPGIGLQVPPEIRQAVVASREAVARRLDHEHGAVEADTKPVLALCIGPDHLLAIGHTDARQAAFPGIAPTVVIAVCKHGAVAGRVRWPGFCREGEAAGNERCEEAGKTHAPDYHGSHPSAGSRRSRLGRGPRWRYGGDGGTHAPIA